MAHHPAITRFKPFQGEVPGGYILDGFLGSIVRQECTPGVADLEPSIMSAPYPQVDEDYFEWIDLLESVIASRGSYTMIELGAGMGRWSVRAALAARQFKPRMPFRLIAVEADPAHFEWLRWHFLDNGIDPKEHRLINAAVSDIAGQVQLCIRGPAGGNCDLQPNEWYGQFLTKDMEFASETEGEGVYSGSKVNVHQNGWKSVVVPSVTLASILKDLWYVDLVDVDIQGEELNVIAPAIDELDAKVQRLHIGTHKPEIEAGLRELLTSHGWLCQTGYSVGTTDETPWGRINFQDGVQSWVNRKLTRFRWLHLKLRSILRPCKGRPSWILSLSTAGIKRLHVALEVLDILAIAYRPAIRQRWREQIKTRFDVNILA